MKERNITGQYLTSAGLIVGAGGADWPWLFAGGVVTGLWLRDGLDQLAAEFRFLATLKIGNGIRARQRRTSMASASLPVS